jgi:hypothetical protein
MNDRPAARRPGLTLVELVFAMLVSFIGLAGIGTLGEVFYRNWRESRYLVRLQEDLDLGSFLLKGVIEEAAALEEIPGGLRATGPDGAWQKDLYRQGGHLMADDEEVIAGLDDLGFTIGEESVLVTLRVTGADGRTLSQALLVRRRN